VVRKLLKILSFTVGLTFANPTANLVFAQDGSPTAEVVEFQQAASLPWYAGVIFFIVVAIGVTILKARIAAGTKKPVMAGNCCAPLIEDGTHPFRPSDDEPS
jgi:hypothetical protein